ncbi:EndoU domain-containing protein [Aquimarina sp. 2201CG1-2-11]|uniref:EndoU domain-containing protein n=1 Tax=Aquimarina discodermiae TaxID=3231043 RepID=UPI003462042C
MKITLFKICFIFLVFFSFKNFAQCPIKSFADDINKIEDFIDNNGVDAWFILFKSGSESTIRQNANNLEFVNHYLKSSSKNVDEVIADIKNKNDFNIWKESVSGTEELIETVFKVIKEGDDFVIKHSTGAELSRGWFVNGVANEVEFTVEVVQNGIRYGYGKAVRKQVYDEMAKTSKIDAIRSHWIEGPDLDTNLNTFNDAIAAGKSVDEAAFATKAGEWNKELGFDKVEIIGEPVVSGGKYKNVIFRFTKKINNAGGKLIDDLVDSVDDAYKAALRVDLEASTELAEAIGKNPELLKAWETLKKANVDDAFRGNPDFLKRFNDFDIPSNSLHHADAGDFTYVPGTNTVSKMKGGGHGQRNLDFLEANNVEYNIVNEFDNGVRVGNVPGHKSKFKRTGTGQSWFPDSWSSSDISDAGKYVGSLSENANLADGVAAFGNYRGVRVGIIKTDGKVGTIFPDSVQ